MSRKIVGINGSIGSGKDSFSQAFIDEGYIRLSFAGSLKDAVSAIFGWDRVMLEGATPDAREERESVDVFWSTKLGFEVTPRKILQLYGTDIMRKHFNDNIWIFSIEKQILNNSDKNIIITDCRFINEIALLRTLNATIIEVQREKPEWYEEAKNYNLYGGDKPASLDGIHISEWQWIGTNHPDFVIKNNSTLGALYDKATEVLNKL